MLRRALLLVSGWAKLVNYAVSSGRYFNLHLNEKIELESTRVPFRQVRVTSNSIRNFAQLCTYPLTSVSCIRLRTPNLPPLARWKSWLHFSEQLSPRRGWQTLAVNQTSFTLQCVSRQNEILASNMLVYAEDRFAWCPNCKHVNVTHAPTRLLGLSSCHAFCDEKKRWERMHCIFMVMLDHQ